MTFHNRQSSAHSHLRSLALVLMLGLLSAGSAQAAGSKSTAADARYQKERAACLSGQSNEDKKTCLRETEAAYLQEKQGKLGDADQTQYRQNALARCRSLPEQDQADCRRRIDNPTAVEGNAQEGGILRKSVTIIQEPASKE